MPVVEFAPALWTPNDGGASWREAEAQLPPIYAVRFA